MVDRLGLIKEKDIIVNFKFIYLNLTYNISKNRKLKSYRIDNLYRRKIEGFIVDYFKKFDVAKFMVVRYYNKNGKNGFKISRFATKDAALNFASKIKEKDKTIFLYKGELANKTFGLQEEKSRPLLEKLFLEQLDFADEHWKAVAEDRW